MEEKDLSVGLNRLLRAWWQRTGGAAATARDGTGGDMPRVAADQLSVVALARVGDAVYELHVRVKAGGDGSPRGRDLHGNSVARVRATAQAATFRSLWPALEPAEQDVARRGRNAHTSRVPKGATSEDYHLATAFETLLGYLFLAGRAERLAEILDAADKVRPEQR
jgi:ribonuclease-3 family protein